jgi:hypothetical protein
LGEWIAVVEDPRVDRTKSHDLQDILVLSVLAVLCGADGWEDMELFATIRFSWLKKFIMLRNCVLSHGTISRVFRMIRPDAFQDAFVAWVSGLNFGSDGLNVVAIDGKSLRRSHDKKSFKSMLHSVAAWSFDNSVVLGCQSADQKSNENAEPPTGTLRVGGASHDTNMLASWIANLSGGNAALNAG